MKKVPKVASRKVPIARRGLKANRGSPHAKNHHSVRPPPKFPIVGIGASAGGLEAFTDLLKELPSDTGMAYVLIQHLDPHHESLAAEILSRVTEIPVSEVKDGTRAVPNNLY